VARGPEALFLSRDREEAVVRTVHSPSPNSARAFEVVMLTQRRITSAQIPLSLDSARSPARKAVTRLCTVLVWMTICAALSMTPAKADAFFIGSVTVGLGSGITDMPGLEVLGIGTSNGSELHFGNALASETHSLNHGSVLGSTGFPFGIATATATGSSSISITNVTANPITYDLGFSYSYVLGTRADTIYDSARLALVVGGSFGNDIDFDLFEPITLRGNDDKTNTAENLILLRDIVIEPGVDNADLIQLRYELIGLATTVPEPSSAILLLIGAAALLTGRWRQFTN
jgi:hypothetical protein